MNRRLMRTTLLSPILLMLLVATADTAFGNIDPSALYHIIAKHSGKCLDVSGGATALANGVRVIQWDCHDEDNQAWTFTPVEGGYYKIIAKHSGKSLDVFGGITSRGNGAVVEQWDYNGAANQMWILIPLGGDYYQICAKHSGKSLDINGGPRATGNGAGAQQWTYWGGDNQMFKLTAVGRGAACDVTDPLTSNFSGAAELRTTHPYAAGPFPSDVNLTVKFSDCRASISITDFPPLTTAFDTLAGRNTSTLRMTGGGYGTFNSSNGLLVIPITLRLENSNLLFGNSTLSLRLAAEGEADAKNAVSGSVTLRGTGTFVGGALNGTQGTLAVTGAFSPRPR
jgi:hypothetical protein